MGLEVISADITAIIDELVRTDSMKTAFQVFSYLMR